MEAFLKKRNSNVKHHNINISASTTNNNRKNPSETVVASNHGSITEEEIEKIKKNIKNNLRNWFKSQEGSLKDFKEGIDYALTVSSVKSEIKCMACKNTCQIGKTKGAYLISNYTRHMLKSCPYLIKKSGGFKQLSLLQSTSNSVSTCNSRSNTEMMLTGSPDKNVIADDEVESHIVKKKTANSSLINSSTEEVVIENLQENADDEEIENITLTYSSSPNQVF